MSNVPSRVNDNNLTTRWSHTMPTWIQMDVGFVTRIGYIKVAWFNAETVKYNYNVEISTTGAANTWVEVISGQSTNVTGLQTINFTDTTGRFVRVNILSAVAATLPAPISSRLKNFGGAMRRHSDVQVYFIWWGSSHTDKSTLQSHISQVFASDYWKGCWQYGVKPFKTPIHVNNTAYSVPGATTIPRDTATACIWDTVDRGLMPQPIGVSDSGWNFDLNNIYVVIIPNDKLTAFGAMYTDRQQRTASSPWINLCVTHGTSTSLGTIPGTNQIQSTEQAMFHEIMHAYLTPTIGGCETGNGWLFDEPSFCNNCQHGPPGTGCGHLSDACSCGNRLRYLSGTTILVESYWSNMDGGCRAPGTTGIGYGGPTGLDTWTRQPVTTTVGGILELEVYGQSQTPPPSPPPPPGPGPSPPSPPPAPTPPSGSLDTDGVKMILAKNMNPGKFHKNMKDLNLGTSWGSSTFFDVDADGSGTRRTEGGLTFYHFNSREGSFASGGSNWTCRPEWVSNRCNTPTGISGARSRGYLCNENDPKNLEYTIICRIDQVQNERDSQHNLTMKWRGDDHVDTNEKTLQGGLGLWYSDVPRDVNLYHVEITHPDVREEPVTFVSPFTASNHPQAPVGGWIGLKTIVWNINNNSGLHAEMWIDTAPINSTGGFSNNWKKVFFKEESRNDTPIWGGPRQQFRIDMAKSLDVAAYSIHEIIPPSATTSSFETPPAPQAPSPASFGSSQKSSKKNVSWVTNFVE